MEMFIKQIPTMELLNAILYPFSNIPTPPPRRGGMSNGPPRMNYDAIYNDCYNACYNARKLIMTL